MAQFLHGACFSPVKITFLKAIKNKHFTSWPGLDERLIEKILLPSMTTEAGYLNQERQYFQSTSTNKKIQERMKKLIQEAPKGQPFKQMLEEDIHKDVFLLSDLPNIKTHQVIFSIIESSHAGIGYTDLTGRFPFRSSRGNEYILIGYHYDANATLAEPIKNMEAETIA